jgi:serine/threonine protein kinase
MSLIEGRSSLHNFKELKPEQAKRCVECLAELHRAKCVHGDVRPQNFVLSGENKIFIIDFGFSKFVRRANDQRLINEREQLMRELHDAGVLDHTASPPVSSVVECRTLKNETKECNYIYCIIK